MIREHIQENGGDGCKYVDIGPNGVGDAIFDTAEEATAAITACVVGQMQHHERKIARSLRQSWMEMRSL